MEKPFGIDELTARIRTALCHRLQADDEFAGTEVDGLKIDAVRRQVSRDGKPLRLTPKEYDLILVLARHAGRVVTQKTLLTIVWEPAHAHDLQYLRVFIGQFRAKVERIPTEPAIIVTEPGVGYRLLY